MGEYYVLLHLKWATVKHRRLNTFTLHFNIILDIWIHRVNYCDEVL
jgi:hypothetical protein